MLITYRKAKVSDIPFMTSMLLESCIASGVFIEPDKLHEFPETEIYIKGWSEETEFGIIAETESGESVGATWIRNLPGLGHSVNEQLPEITIAVSSLYRKKGIASELMNRLYKLSVEYAITKLSLGVHRDNLPALKLYEKQGWIKDGIFKDYIMMSRKTDIKE
ncbi:MAG: GNAT family N-acetyltransferase [Dysgonomonas sp.]|nr:GNAT family N-acetyltransferase [Dysgonomonas sp.]